MQPLDVAVFAPIKDKWKQVLRGWKLECDQNDTSYATLPKKVFPSLLKATLEKDYSESIRSGKNIVQDLKNIVQDLKNIVQDL